MQTRKIGLSILFFILSIQLFGQLPGYSFYKILTIQSAQVQGPGNHLDFPVLIKHTDLDLRHTGSGGDVQNINGWDIKFTAADGVTPLDHQLELYTSTTGELVAWVRVPSVSSTVNTDIRIYYGNASIIADQSLSSTWNSKYKGVWHLHNDILDGTSNAHNMTNASTTNQATCIAADGQDFTTGQSLTRALDPTLQFTGDLTLEGWVRLAVLQGGTYDNVVFACGGGSETAANNFNYYLSVDGTRRIRTYWESGAGIDNQFTSSVVSTIAVNVWMHITLVRNVATNSLLFYTNGTQLGTPVAFANDPTGGTTSVFRIGQDPFTIARDMRGDLDELRISDTLRSPEWIRTNYNSMFSPSTFYLLGAETIGCPSAPTIANAGPDQSLCVSAVATLAGNTPTVGTGAWTVVAGGGTVTTPSSPTSGITGLSFGTNTFRWTISIAGCTSTSDDITITRYTSPTLSAAGPNQTLCSTVATLAGNNPISGTGAWTVIAGGATVTTPSSPTSGVTGLTGGTNTFRWTISNGTCTPSTDDITIIRDVNPTTSTAGPDQTICLSSATLAGNNPIVGTGVWTVIAGAGSVTTPSSPTSGVTGLSIGANTFRWTISNGICLSSSDDITINLDQSPTTAAAGSDQNVCLTTATLAGNTPLVGTGVWTVISGGATVTTPSSPTSGITGLAVGVNTFRWTISNGVCPPLSDDITITRIDFPTTAAAGPDQTLCSTSATLAGNAPTIGTGAWTVIAGAGTVTTPTSPTSGVTGLSVGVNTFRWTISNSFCTTSTDDITITRDATPTISAAGPDQSRCATNAILAGNAPTTGTGAWTVIAGGATVTTPTSPTSGVTGLSVGVNTFRWTISNGTCVPSTDDVTITRYVNPTVSAAGPDQNICATTATLAGNTPAIGTGLWTVIAGPATITTPTSPTSGVTGLGVGVNTFRWTISNGSCTASFDNITINRTNFPTTSAAGPDQTLCATVATLAGNTPGVGTGAWTVIAGGATLTTPTSPTSGVTGLTVGVNTFRWTISNGICTPSTDDITIIRDQVPTISAAGTDQNLCATTGTLAGNTPTVGTGLWTVISGGATITTPTSPTSGVTGLSVGVNTFRWTISNGVCTSSSDDITITRTDFPTISVAGVDQAVCATSSTLAANSPTVGTGLWTVIAGPATITTPASPTSGVTGLGVGVNTFRWTISNGICPVSTDEITITRIDFPTISAAGSDQTICSSTSTLNGNAPSVGTGNWTVISGGAIVTTPTSPTSGVTGLSIGINTFVWTISNGICTSSTDTITIYVDPFPTVANAGIDSTICSFISTLNGNTPVIGTGLWTVVSGSGTVVSPTAPNSGINGMNVGVNTFAWTISNGTCPISSDTVDYIIDPFPTAANAGFDSTICSTSSSLNGNVPVIGTGAWTVITGSGTLTSSSSASPGVNGMSIGVNTFVWSITSGTCPASYDTVNYIVDAIPTVSAAGPNQTVCAASATLAGNTPIVGTGLWTVITGGATITTPTSPTSGVTVLSFGINTFRWTISNGVCSPSFDEITIFRDAPPTTSAAGPNQTLCATTATLAGNTPTVGTGTWTVIAGGATVTTPSSPTSGVTGLSVGVNTFRWTISNGVCTSSFDDVTIIRDNFPTVSAAGIDQTVCATTATLAGNAPTVGTGTWTVITGGATVTTPSSPTSGVIGLSVGVNTFRWTISNGTCTPSFDEITINRLDFPTPAAAGPDQTLCATTSTLAGNTPTVGIGTWTVITGSATVTTPSSPTSGVTGLSFGTNTFRWTISNGICTPSTDDIIIFRDTPPTTSAAGIDQTVCVTTATLAGNAPTVGTGLWTVITGGATVTTPSSPTSGVIGLSVGVNTFRWTISNGTCSPSFDEITINRLDFPTPAAAGPDQTLCATTSTLAGNTPIVGTGTWTVITGSATVTTPASPTSGVTGLSLGTNTFRWTISNGICTPSTDDITIFRDTPPTTSAAGPDQTVCSTSATLAGNTPVVGTGAWTVIVGTAIITTPTSPTSGVTGLNFGVNTFRWTISNGTCAPSFDEITIFRDTPPTTSAAGPNQTLCTTIATLAGNNPIVGTGSWTVITGSATVTTPASPTSGVTGLSFGTNTFRWTISNGVCTPSTDDITIFRDTPPTTSAAGLDQTICVTSATLAGNTPTVGTGLWTVITGGATVTTPSSPTSGVTGLSVGTNTFRWTISNGTCSPSFDEITIDRLDFPTPSLAGTDQTLCSTTATLAANTPIVGTGNWTVITGSGTVTTPTSPTSGVTGLSFGVNTFRWTISNGLCTPSTDDITIFRDTPPTTAAAGVDQTVCATTATLAGNTPVVGTGAWIVISGTGILTTPTSPTSGVTGLSVGINIFRWTISNGTCSPSFDEVTIDRLDFPTPSAAGPDQTVCATTATLAANTPIVGTGSWSVVTGSATITTPTSPTSGVTGLSFGINTFRWRITNGLCIPSNDDITIFRDTPPTTSTAGPDQTVCATIATLAGNNPIVGTGAWTVVSGTGIVTTPTSPTSGVTGLSFGVNTFRWTISNGVCPSSIDDIIIFRDTPPTTSAAGPDQIVCSPLATLAANTPTVGTGVWTVVSGTGIVTTPTSPTSGATGLSLGVNIFQWTISNGTCSSSSDNITVNSLISPTIANAGPDQTVCTTSATLAGNTPVVGTGSWSVIAGTGVVTTPTLSSSGVTGLSLGINTFVWTITSGSCPTTYDTIDIDRQDYPTTSAAGSDQTICATTTSLSANTPIVGTGVWTVVTGGATLITPTSPTSVVTGLSVGVNTFRWTISNGVCTPSIDDVIINRDEVPTTSSAGIDQTLCSTTATLAGNAPTVGTGLWTVVVGSSTLTTPSSPTSGVTGLSVGLNTFVWTISNGVCSTSFDSISIFRFDFPTSSNAGPDQTICSNITILVANTPIVGTGIWTVITGSGTVASPTSSTSGVFGLSFGVNTFRWTISNGVCAPSVDEVTIFRDTPPTTATAGIDQTICSASSTLAGNTPVVGTGLWTIVTGSATITSPSSPTSGITGLGVGLNTFVWTISNGTCTPSFDSISIFRFDFPTIANAGPDQTLCSNLATLAANAPTVGTGVWTVITGSATVTTPTSPSSGITGLSFGVNTFRWTISNGVCAPSVDEITIFRDTPPTTATAGVNQTICSPSATLAGNTPFVGTGLWTIIAGSGTITTPSSPTTGVTGLSVGVNTFVWTISNGVCANSVDSISIFRFDFPTVSNAGSDQTICNSATTLAGNAPTVGTGVWTVISGGATITTPTSPTSGITGLSFGANTFRWTISNGVCAPSIDDVTIFRDTPPTTSTAGIDQTICSPSATLAGNTPFVGTGLWTLVAGSGTITSPSSPTSGLTGLGVGLNTFVWTISNGVCANSFDSISIFRFDFPTTANAGFDSTICASSSTLNGNIPVVGTGVWSVIAGSGIVATPTNATSAITGMSIGANSFVWSISNGVCLVSKDTVTINVDDFPTVANAGPDFLICASSAILNGNTPIVGTGLWTIVSGSGTIVNPTSPSSAITGVSVGVNTFVWTISNGTCLPTFDTVVVTINTFATPANAGIDSTICSPSSSLNGNVPIVGIGTWSVISGTSTLTDSSNVNSGVNGLSVGTNTFVWTITSGACPVSYDTVNYFVDPLPTIANAGFDSTICTSTSTLNGNTPAIGSGMWTVVSGLSTLIAPSSPTCSVTSLSVGTNTFVWTISNGTCPSTTDTVSIFVDPFPTTANAGIDSTLCTSSSTLNGNTPTIGTGMWTVISGTGILTTPSSPSSAITSLSVGMNSFVWTTSNGTCVSSTDTVNYFVDQFPTLANAGFDSTICAPTSTLNGNTPSIGTGEWTLVSGSGTLTTPTSPTCGITGMLSGNNIFVWTISNGTCPSTTDTVSIFVDPFPTTANAGIDSAICSYSSSLNGNIPTIGTGLWTLISGTGIISSPTSPNTSVTGLSTGSNIFRWTVSNSTCPSTFDEVEIWVDTLPTIANAGIDISTNFSSINLNANTPLIGVGTWSITSSSGTFTNFNDPTTLISNLNSGANILLWTISNGACPSTFDEVIITLFNYNVPNGFSPNGDGTNDFFEIPGLSDYTNVELDVFNRWGNLVYSNSDYKNDWNGNNNSGEKLSDDTYYYILKLDAEHIIKGYVVIKTK